MALNLTFKQVREMIEKDQDVDPVLIDAVDRIFGLTIICAPAFLGPAAAGLLPLLGVKNELVKIGKTAFSKLTGKDDKDYLSREQRMQAAYGLICYTAFFDALDRSIPNALRAKISLLESEKAFLAQKARTDTGCKDTLSQEDTITLAAASPFTSVPLPFPRPVETIEKQVQRHSHLWEQMSHGFMEFVQKLAFWEKDSEEEQRENIKQIRKVSKNAAKCFEAQYFELARRYEDFAVWANLQEHKGTKKLIGSLSEYVQQHAALVAAAKTEIDFGLAKLHQAVLSIPETLKTSQATEIFDSLKRHSEERILEPIAERGDTVRATQGHSLRFPRIVDAFVPQSFQVLRSEGRVRSLEDPQTWKGLDRREDLGAFFLSFLTSPYSTETPLVVLGHPGSGKSLLTKVLSAQLMSVHFTVVRVPLREVDAESGVVAQIEERIRSVTHASDPWAKLSGTFKNNPPLVILDGYDELLQASGKVFRSYLNDVRNFQRNEFEQRRPVRVMVTSRITLIDKAIIPEGTTIIRLLEFDQRQRSCWVKVWNRENAAYFREASIDEFALPDDHRNSGAKIISLAKQPLLLLMLALYDSEGNALRKSKSLDRTILYDSLLRRFVAREMAKGKDFFELSSKEQERTLDAEMQRLAVAALGMYNRRKLHILSTELNADIKFFSLERPIAVSEGRELSQAELLLGRFFFVHKSEAQVKASVPVHDGEAAFEFLHNTFGEFLTADFVLRQAVNEAVALKALEENEDLRAQLQQRLGAADGFDRAWFASLVYRPFFTRPVVLEMIREWVDHALKRKSMSKKEFLAQLDTLVMNQLKRLLEKREMPSIIRKEMAQEGFRAPFGDHPLLGHIAIYSMNLVLLRAIVTDEPFVFDESRIGHHEDGARPWDRLAHIWRSWFALDNLNGVTAVLDARRRESVVEVTAKKRFQLADSQSRIETYFNVAASLGDDIGTGLTGLVCHETLADAQIELSDVRERLLSERIDLEFLIVARRLWHIAREDATHSIALFRDLAKEALHLALRHRADHELLPITLSIQTGFRSIKRAAGSPREIIDIFREAVNPKVALEVGVREPAAGVFLFRLADELHDYEWKHRFWEISSEFGPIKWNILEPADFSRDGLLGFFGLLHELERASFSRLGDRRFFESALDLRILLELAERKPEAASALVQLARKFGGERILERADPEFVERLFNPQHFMELLLSNSDVALKWVQLFREVGGSRIFRHMDPEALERMFHPRHLIELLERNPDAALVWVQLAREVGGDRIFRHMDPEVFERMFHLRHLLELLERNPEAAVVWVQLAREVDVDWFSMQREDILNLLSSSRIKTSNLLYRNSSVITTILWLVRMSGSEGAAREVIRGLSEGLQGPGHIKPLLDRLPISALSDIKWLIRHSGDQEFARRFQFLMDSRTVY
jgi:hypothetical protein